MQPKLRRTTKPEFQSLVVPRRIALFVAGLLVCSLAGLAYQRGLRWGHIWSGRKRFANQQQTEKARILRGKIEYSTGGYAVKSATGISALVLAFPSQQRLAERILADDIIMSLKRGEVPAEIMSVLRGAGAGIQVVPPTGEFELNVRGDDRFSILVMSNLPKDSEASREDLAEIGKFVIPAFDLLDGRRFRLLRTDLSRSDFLHIDL